MNGENQLPLISIGMPAFNGERFIGRALDSLLGQSYPYFELIVSDNASTDGTRRILDRYAASDPRIKIYKQEKNIGILQNFHFVLDQAKGDYFIWTACDDWWDPDFMKTLVNALRQHPECGVAMSSFAMVSEEGKPCQDVLLTGKNNLNGLSYNAVFQRMVGRHPIHVFIYGLFRRPFLKSIMKRPFPNCMMGDRILMSEIALSTHLYCIETVLHRRTIHEKNLAQRYGEEEFGMLWKERRRFFKLYWIMWTRLLGSKNVPWRRKAFSVPIGWIRLVYRGSGKMLKSAIRRMVINRSHVHHE